MASEIYLLTLVIAIASILALVVSKFKQPILIAYILAGALLSAFHLVKPEQLEFLAILPEVGLAFLLFLVGMELDLREFRKLGKNIILVTLGQVAITTITLFFLTGHGIIAFVTAFSSTILVVKILLEEKELSSLHGKIAVGSLLIEDLLAVIFLMGLSLGGSLPALIIKGVFLIWLSLIAGKKFLPRVFNACAQSGELLFLTAIGWCLLFVSLSIFAGFSLAIGAFLAGVSLAQSLYRIQISGKIKPLRDFFIMIFFLDLGTGLSISGVRDQISLALTLLIFAVVVKPLIFYLLLNFMRFRSHASFQTAVLISSISEFSLIVLAAASKNGLVDSGLMSPVIFAAVSSFIISSFLMTHSRRLYQFLRRPLKKLERQVKVAETAQTKPLENHAVLIGCHRAGGIILHGLKPIFGEDVVVLDFNPDVVEELNSKAINCVYGDAADLEVLESLNLIKADLVVSTVRDLKDNLAVLDYLEKIQSRAVIILTAEDLAQAAKLYERGAHYVSLPTDLEGASITRIIHEHAADRKWFLLEREKKLGEVKSRLYA